MAQVDISALNVRLYCDNWPTLWRFVKAGVGCAVLPAAYVEASADVVAVPPVEGFQKNPFYLVYGKEKSDWPRVREFVAMCASKLGEG
jgi:DNA-binding transcriptional LysR family regulator